MFGRTLCWAFSLVEVLVVIATIALLMGLIVPALRRAKSVAKQTVCQSQLRQWGLAFEIYAGQNDGFYPHIDGLDRQGDERPVLAKDWADYFGWVDMLPPLMGEMPWRSHEPWQYPAEHTMFQCPAARLARPGGLAGGELYKYRPRRNGFFSYAMNSCLELDENCWHHPDDTKWPMPSFLDTALIWKPSRIVLLFDQLLDPRFGYNANQVYGNAGNYCGSYPKSFSARHAKPGGLLGGSILYCDYHVEWQASVWKPDWSADLEVPPRDDLDWYPYQ
jgi:competence protein ComGC